jgi:WD40 repeat protein
VSSVAAAGRTSLLFRVAERPPVSPAEHQPSQRRADHTHRRPACQPSPAKRQVTPRIELPAPADWPCRPHRQPRVSSPDGSRIATASDDATARAWDLDGNTVATVTGHTSAAYTAVSNPDGLRIVTASFDGTARVWPVWQVSDMRHELARRLGDREFTQAECGQYRIEPCPP